MNKLQGAAALFIAIFFAACKPGLEPELPSSGQVDFSNYIAIGNSLTAGYADNSLYRSGQEHSFPAILAQQLSYVGSHSFHQPLLPGESGWPSAKLVLHMGTDCKGDQSLSPTPYPHQNDTAGSHQFTGGEPLNNLGIPGIRCVDLSLPGYPAFNHYARRIVGQADVTLMDFFTRHDPTFFTLWVGNNDVLGYATGGGEGNKSGMGLNDISPVAVFRENYEALVKKLTAKPETKGALINIPDVTSIPFFTTIEAFGSELNSQEVEQMNQFYRAQGLRFTEGKNYFVIEDPHSPYGVRKIKDGEFLLLTIPQDSLKCASWGKLRPIPKRFVLSEDEVAAVREATRAFNRMIAEFAEEYGLALVDAHSYMKTFQSGMSWEGVRYSLTFVSGGVFSLDGVHLTPRGNALVANEIIRAVNHQYKSSIPFAEVNQFPGILFP